MSGIAHNRMADALQLVRDGRLAEATALLQGAGTQFRMRRRTRAAR